VKYLILKNSFGFQIKENSFFICKLIVKWEIYEEINTYSKIAIFNKSKRKKRERIGVLYNFLIELLKNRKISKDKVCKIINKKNLNLIVSNNCVEKEDRKDFAIMNSN
jgi:hypothetical protein